jgi:hypothetical protein
MPETKNASAIVSSQRGSVSFPRASPSAAAPASISACAHAPCASICSVEFVKNTITGHIHSPIRKAVPGQR